MDSENLEEMDEAYFKEFAYIKQIEDWLQSGNRKKIYDNKFLSLFIKDDDNVEMLFNFFC